MISPVFGQSAKEILEIALERSLALNNSYYKFVIESEVESTLLPITGELFTKGEKYFIDTKDIDQIYDGQNIFTIVHENQEIILDNSDFALISFTPNQIFNFFWIILQITIHCNHIIIFYNVKALLKRIRFSIISI